MAILPYGNQWVINFYPRPSFKKNYVSIYNETIFHTLSNLTSNEFRLWGFIYVNLSNSLILNQKYVCAKTGIAQSSFYKAKKGLIDKGYLIPLEATLLSFYADIDYSKNSEQYKLELLEKKEYNISYDTVIIGDKRIVQKNTTNFTVFSNSDFIQKISFCTEENTQAENLSYAGLKLYFYLSCNSFRQQLNLSSKHIKQTINLSRTAYYDGFQELQEHGLLSKGSFENNFIF